MSVLGIDRKPSTWSVITSPRLCTGVCSSASAPRTLPVVHTHTHAIDVYRILLQAGRSSAGVDINDGSVADMVEAGVLDVAETKMSAVKLAADAAITILRVDQIIMAKQAGG